MKYELVPLFKRTLQIVLVFIVAMVGLIVILDFILLPILVDFFIDDSDQKWCGVFTRCASGMGPLYVEYFWAGGPWEKLNMGATLERIKSAAIVGVLVGIGFTGISFFPYRR